MEGPAVARLEELLAVGSAIMVATHDDHHRPHVTRGWGGRLDPATGRLDLAITVSDDLQVVADLEANSAVAVTFVRPSNYLAMQVTGLVEWIGEIGPDDRERIDDHIERFVEEVVPMGMPRSVATIAGDRFVTIRIAMRQFFDQTPGHKAGSAM
jgi:general stress protein 26